MNYKPVELHKTKINFKLPTIEMIDSDQEKSSLGIRAKLFQYLLSNWKYLLIWILIIAYIKSIQLYRKEQENNKKITALLEAEQYKNATTYKKDALPNNPQKVQKE